MELSEYAIARPPAPDHGPLRHRAGSERRRRSAALGARGRAAWPDQPLPALNGRTPREAVRTARGRTAVDLLLKDLENREQRAGGDAAFDLSAIHRELGLDPPG